MTGRSRSAVKAELTFAPLPAKRDNSGESFWNEHLAPMLDRPGDWARIATHPTRKRASNHANLFRRRKVRYPEGDWEFTTRTAEDGTSGEVWACYFGADPKGRAKRRAKASGREAAPTFWHFLMARHDAKGPIGELARYAIKDPKWPKHGNAARIPSIVAYAITKAGPVPNWVSVAVAAYREERGER